MKQLLLIFTFLFLGNLSFAQVTGNALDFDGTDDYVDAGTGMSSITDYTIEANIYYKGGSAWIMHFSDGTLNERLQLEIGGGQLVSYNQSAGVGTSVFAGGTIVANTWYHIAITNSSVNGKKLYVNGVEVASNSNTLSPSQMPTGTHFSIGRIHNQPYYFNGTIDEVRVWNVVRTQAQLAANMNTELSAQTGLVGLYRFNQGIANGTNTGITTAIDASGNANNGTLSGFALSGNSSNWVAGVVTSIPAPNITSFSPLNAKLGDAVTLTGTGFNTTTANNIVFFGATRAIVTAATATSVTVTVPSGATYAPITLLNTGSSLAAYSLRNFTPTYSPAKTNILAGDFAAKQDFATEYNPQSVAISDLDGDGKPDLVVANHYSNSVSVYRNTSTNGSVSSGSFAAKVDFATGSQPISVAIGDLDCDGKPDLAVANRSSTTFSVFRNTSTSGSITAGSFAAKVDFAIGGSLNSIAIGDLDGDGKPDLAVTNQSSVSVIRNTSTSGSITAGSFAAKVDFATGSSPYSVAIGDLDGDGKPDLAVANSNTSYISVIHNTSTIGSITAGSFATRVDFTAGTSPTSVAIGDLDGDGKPDLAVANKNSQNISVFRNTTTSGSITAGSFATGVAFTTGTSPYSVAISDLDGDSKPDLAVTNQNSQNISVFHNTAINGSITSGSFAAKVDFATGTSPYSVAISDLDGDGKPDLVVANEGSNTVSILQNISSNADLSALAISSGTLSPTFASGTTTYTASVSNNITSVTVTPTKLDATATIEVRVNSGSYATVNSGNASVALSLNEGSNTIDVKVTAQDGTTIKTYTTTVTRAIGPPIIASFSPTSAKPGDAVTLTGTGFNTTVANNIVFFGATQATVTPATATSVTVTVPSGATYAPITLLNTGNGLAAYSLKNFTPTYSPAKTNILAGDFAAKVDFTTVDAPNLVAVGDIDGDGKPDLVVANSGSSFSVYRNISSSGSIGAGSFAPKVDFATNTKASSIALADLDGDGKLDLVFVNYRSFDFGPNDYSANDISIFRNTSTSGSITTGSFATKVNFVTGNSPNSVAIDDLDGDGKLDLAVAYLNGVSVFRNTTTSGNINTGSFAAKQDFTTGGFPNSIDIGDIDGDGKPDLVITKNDYGVNGFSVLRNTTISGNISSGSFAAKVDFATDGILSSLILSDLDGDGKLDVAAFNSEGVEIFRNTATNGSITSGSFAAKVYVVTVSNRSKLMAIGDLDGDGKPDMAVGSYESPAISVYRNIATMGSITSSIFATNVDFATGTYSNSVAIGDLDGDGKPDLIATNSGSNTVSILQNVSNNADLSNLSLSSGTLSPTFAAGTIAYTASVTNGVSSLTVTPTKSDANATIEVRVNGGSYATQTSGNASGSLTLAVGTNTIDVKVTAQDGATIKTYTTTVTRAIGPPIITSFSPLNAKPGDPVTLTGTGFNTTSANNIVFFGATQATVTAATATSVTVTVPSGATYAPITLLNTGTSLAAYTLKNFTPTYSPAKTNIAAGDFATKQEFTAGTNPFSLAMGDLDGDGKPDLAVATYGSNTVSVYRNISSTGSIGSGSFAAKVDFATGSQPWSVAIGDLDGDGKPDLAVTNFDSHTVSVYRNTSSIGSIGSGSFATKVDFATGLSPWSAAIGDLDGDGKPDLAVTNYSSYNVSILRNTSTLGSLGTGSFASKIDFSTGDNPISVTIGDLDGDGKPDLAVTNSGLSTVSVLRNTSSSGSISAGSFAVKQDFTTGDNPFLVAIGDLDGDGKPDLAITNQGSSTVSVLRNTSSSGSISAGSFAVKQDFVTGNSPFSVAIGDLDGDGKPDLAVTNQGSSTVSVYRNTSSTGSIGSGSFTPKVDFITSSNPYLVIIGDLNGDSKPELVISSQAVFSVLQNVSKNADLSNLSISSGTLSPTFAAGTITYTANVDNTTTSITVTPTKSDASTTIQVQVNSGGYATLISGNASTALVLNAGSNTVEVKVTAQDGSTTKTYTITVEKGTLPVSLIDYQAKIQNNKSVLLSWTTISEQNNQGFEILKSTDGKIFSKTSFIKGNGNSSSKNQYSFTDLFPVKGENYYKLVQIDLDGTKTVLGIKAVNFSFDDGSEIKIYPNPSTSIVNVEFETNQFSNISVIDLAGKVIIKKEIAETESKVSLNILELPASTFIIKLQGKSGVMIKQFVKQ
ncbi:FG-GAP-like repeat-containing protein [Pedobacter cryophilus]|uniref:T9SS type A sorting domain-containing protein n=1 Tax=Pedobacter cryophilus TaxID=2571271 RepID=A0A4U1C4P6_9SPHI|nr:FG-GAP-like repeat-containing protein [Pedobacter cryophilus]TKC00339.1 T9SS type A sorting domain-containing protein [Pedobacter cryophilus]